MQLEQPSVDDRVVQTFHDGRMLLKDGSVVTTLPQPAAQISREIRSGRQSARALERIHRKLGDLPDIPQKMNPVAAVLLYSCIGLNNADIATALGASEKQIEVIKDSELYSKLFQLFDTSVFEDARRNAKHIISRAADHAAETMVAALGSNDEAIALAASREVLKTAGVSSESGTEDRLSGLNIRITRKEDDSVNINVGV